MAYLPSYRQSDKDELDELEAIEREVSLAHQQVERVEILLQREEAKAGKVNGAIDYKNGSESLKRAVRAYNAAAGKYGKAVDRRITWLKSRFQVFGLILWFYGRPDIADTSQDLKIC